MVGVQYTSRRGYSRSAERARSWLSTNGGVWSALVGRHGKASTHGTCVCNMKAVGAGAWTLRGGVSDCDRRVHYKALSGAAAQCARSMGLFTRATSIGHWRRTPWTDRAETRWAATHRLCVSFCEVWWLYEQADGRYATLSVLARNAGFHACWRSRRARCRSVCDAASLPVVRFR